MTDFLATTPFSFVRRLAAAGPATSSLYLLICDADESGAILADMTAEVRIQLSQDVQTLAGSELQTGNLKSSNQLATGDLLVIVFDRWLPKVVSSLDRNIVLLTGGGITTLIATPGIADRVLGGAPNLRNRLTDVLILKREDDLADSQE